MGKNRSFEYKYGGMKLSIFWDAEDKQFRATCEPFFKNVALRAEETGQARGEVATMIKDTTESFLGRAKYLWQSIAPKANRHESN